MRGLPTDPHDSFASPATQIVASIVTLGAVFALLVAAAYPGVAAAFVLGGISAVAVRWVTGQIAASSGLCVPGTDVCLRKPRS